MICFGAEGRSSNLSAPTIHANRKQQLTAISPAPIFLAGCTKLVEI